MKRVLLVLVAVGAIVALRPMAARMREKLRQHVGRMASQCKQIAGHCRQMAAPVRSSGEAAR